MYKLENITGASLKDYQQEIINLRISVFREWPYLYKGDIKYEKEYLKPFIDDPQSICVVCKSPEGKVVGISTAMPLASEHRELLEPVVQFGFNIDEIYYLGESCLHPEHRGKGLYKQLFARRLNQANKLGFKKALFCGVIREDNHPLKPKNYNPLDEYWRSQGFKAIDGLQVNFKWLDVDKNTPTHKPLQVWLKELN